MAKFNLSVFLNTYSDAKNTNSPNFQNFKWNRQINGVQVENATSQTMTIPANSTVNVFTTGNKKMVYLETSAAANIRYNNNYTETILPSVINSTILPGISLKTSDITSMSVTNPSTTDTITVFIATVE